MPEQTNGADVDPRAAPLLQRLARIGTADDTIPTEAERLAEQEAVVAELERLAAETRADERVEDTAADVERLRAAALDPVHSAQSLPAFRRALEERRRALGLEDTAPAPSLAERLLARLRRPPLVHVPTSLPTLDAATRGGLLLRRVHVIGGEPDAGKTALLVQMLLHAASQGYAVGLYAVDEPGEGIEDRIGQSLGLALEDMEANVERAILWLVDRVRELPHFLLLEQDDGCGTVEEAAERLLAHAKRHGCRGAIFGVDSFQTARCRAHIGPTAPRTDRDRIEAVTMALKALARRGMGVIATSELGRASYAEKPGARAPSPMAAFKGSGSIEYAMTVGMVLTRIRKGEHAGDVRLILPKNKRGDTAYRNAAIRLERDADRCTYTDCGRIDDGEHGEGTAAPAKEKPSASVPDALLERVRYQLRTHPRGVAGGIDGLAALVGGKAPTTRQGIRQMLASGEVERRGTRLFLRDQETVSLEPSAAQLRGAVLGYLAAEAEAGRIVPSLRALGKGLRERGEAARNGDIADAVAVLVEGGLVVRDGQRLSLP